MKKRNFKFGFTLIELMVAVGLFAALMVGAYTLLKNSLDSTLAQKTQQVANDNAKTIISLVADDLKSSNVISASMATDSVSAYQYQSSVIFPATSQQSTVGNASGDYPSYISATSSLVSAPSVYNNTVGISRNKNRLVFYKQQHDNDTGDLKSYIIEYRVVADTDFSNCSLRKIKYDWTDIKWTGLTMAAGIDNTLGIDGKAVTFSNPDSLGTEIETNDLLTLPNRGDAIMLSTMRTLDDRGVTKLSANQYEVKVIVFQTVRPFNTSDEVKDYFDVDSGALVMKSDFVNLFSKEADSIKGKNVSLTSQRKNYRFAEISSIVTVPSFLKK